MLKAILYLSFLFIAFFTLSCDSSQEKTEQQIIDNPEISLTRDSLNSVPDSLLSVMTCPNCNFKKEEVMPTEFCLLKYSCASCSIVIEPKKEDCCVFCSYGTKKCPSMQ